MPKCSSIKARNRSRKSNYQSTQGKYNSCTRWNKWEEALIMDRLLTDREVSNIIQRSVMAIQIHRHNINKLLN